MSIFLHSARGRFSRWISEAIVVVAALSCSLSDPVDPYAAPPLIPAVSISVSPTSATLLIGEIAYLSALPVDARGAPAAAVIDWTSSNPNVASVGRTNGNVTAIGVGTTVVTASSQGIYASATITVRAFHPAAKVSIAAFDELIVYVGSGQRLTAVPVDDQGRFTPVPVEWTSDDPDIASIGRTDGQVTGLAPGVTTLVATAGAARATIPIQVVPLNFLAQWASSAAASSQVEPDNFSAAQATGAPNAGACVGQWRAWVAGTSGVEWLELAYATAVQPSEIRIYEIYAPASIIKVEIKNLAGQYHTVYTSPLRTPQSCVRTLSIPITTVAEAVIGVRIWLDQKLIDEEYGRSGIDAVRLIGYR